MAILNFNTGPAIDMNAPELARFNTLDTTPTSTNWSWITPDGTDIDLDGTGLTFDAAGHATGGLVNTVKIDVGNNNFANPNIEVTGLNISATGLDFAPSVFWRAVLGGNDIISGPTVAEVGTTQTSTIFGDGTAAAPFLSSQGGNDFIDLFDASVSAVGDVTLVGSDTTGAATAFLTGGDDQMFGGATDLFQAISGDVSSVLATGGLLGGDDFLQIANSDNGSQAVGDAFFVQGVAGTSGFVQGGDDSIVAVGASVAQLIGDVLEQKSNATVKGGDDTITGSEQGEEITGDVRVIASATGQSFVGGDDELFGNGGGDVISGDVFFATPGANMVAGNDTVHGGQGSDLISGEGPRTEAAQVTGGNDLLFGDGDDDFLFGQSGNDALEGGTGADDLDGGEGIDIASYNFAASGLTADLLRADLNTGDAKGDTYVSIENLAGSFFADKLSGNNAANVIGGRAGADVMIGRGGADQLVGEGGNDRLEGGAGADILSGGADSDTASYAFAQAGVRVDILNTALNTGDATGDSFSSVENLSGSNFADILSGDGFGNLISGGAGNDTLNGRSGIDRLDGGTGNDLVTGGVGNDTLTGGDGTDSFLFNTALSVANVDTIEDFNVFQDTIRIDNAVFAGLPAGPLAAGAFAVGAAATQADDRIIYNNVSGALTFDANGSAAGGAVQFATLDPNLALTAADILVV